MYKKELVGKIAKKTKVAESTIEKVLNTSLSEISMSLKKGKKVTLRGFGSFVIRKKKKRTMNSIFTSKPVVVPAHKAAAFEPGYILKKLVR